MLLRHLALLQKLKRKAAKSQFMYFRKTCIIKRFKLTPLQSSLNYVEILV